MPGVEVYTISGFGAGPVLAPDAIPSGDESNAPAAAARAPSSPSAPPVLRLQNALRALGTTAGDPLLIAVQIDGVVGPKTTAAVNHALANYVGGTPGFPSANLTSLKVRQSAAVLADRIEARTRASGGTVPKPPTVAAKARRASSAPSYAASASVAAEPPDRRWIYWAAGGFGALVLLAAAASAVKKRRAAQEAT